MTKHGAAKWDVLLFGGAGLAESRGAVTGLRSARAAVEALNEVEAHETERVKRVVIVDRQTGQRTTYTRYEGTGMFPRPGVVS